METRGSGVFEAHREGGQSKDGAGGEKALSSPSFAEARERGERSGGLRSRGERARGGL